MNTLIIKCYKKRGPVETSWACPIWGSNFAYHKIKFQTSLSRKGKHNSRFLMWFLPVFHSFPFLHSQPLEELLLPSVKFRWNTDIRNLISKIKRKALKSAWEYNQYLEFLRRWIKQWMLDITEIYLSSYFHPFCNWVHCWWGFWSSLGWIKAICIVHKFTLPFFAWWWPNSEFIRLLEHRGALSVPPLKFSLDEQHKNKILRLWGLKDGALSSISNKLRLESSAHQIDHRYR